MSLFGIYIGRKSFLISWMLAAAVLAVRGQAVEAYLIDCSKGIMFNSGVRGQNPDRGSGLRAETLTLCYGTSVRSIPAGGLDADTYDWRNNWSGRDGRPFGLTTLDALREIRDRGSWGVFTANVWGGGYLTEPNGWEWRCEYIGDEAVARLAADWVRYINRILQIYRQGDLITEPRDVHILNSINWRNKHGVPLPKLLAPGEARVAPSVYWEIGNEPEVGDVPGFILNHYLSPQEYSRRYRLITAAMKAEDPNIKVGPCCLNPAYVQRVIQDGGVVDFVSYHPYYEAIYNAWPGQTPNIPGLENGLANLKQWMNNERSIWAQFGKPLIASEYNPIHWQGVLVPLVDSTCHALACAESVFTFAEHRILAAHYWVMPSIGRPARLLWEKLQQKLGNILVDSYSAGQHFRLYTTTRSNREEIVLWGLNFSDSQDVSLNISLSGMARAREYRIVVSRLKSITGDTSLASSGVDIDWVESSFVVSRPENIDLLFENATITVVSVSPVRPPNPPPLALRNCDVGGGDFALQKGVWNTPQKKAVGLNNIGLLIRTYGRVTQIYPDYFLISDGSITGPDGRPVGLRIDFPYAGDVGDYVVVTGISGRLIVGGLPVGVVKPRSAQDVSKVVD